MKRLLVFGFWLCGISQAFAKDVVLMISASPYIVSSGGRIGFRGPLEKSFAEDFLKIYRQQLPDHEILTISPRSAESLKLGYLTRDDFTQQVQELLTPDRKITHLILNDHGSFGPLKGETTPMIQLFTLGSFPPPIQVEGATGAALVQHGGLPISLLKGHFAPHPHVYLMACSVFGGKNKDVEASAQGLMQWMGINDGTLYGPRFPTALYPLIDHPNWKARTAVCTALGICAFATMPFLHHAGGLAYIGLAIAGTIPAALDIFTLGLYWEKGAILEFKDGKVISNLTTRRVPDRQKILGLPCEAALAQNP